MGIKIVKPGLFSTIQDTGRKGFGRFGVNRNGPMDPCASALANLVVGNPRDAAVLEMHFPAAELRFEDAAVVAVCGADFAPSVNDAEVENWRPLLVEPGSRLVFRERRLGNRAYLAIRGGFSADCWLGSVSTNAFVGIGGFRGRRLKAGDALVRDLDPVMPTRPPAFAISPSLIPKYSAFPTVRITRGGEFERMTAKSQSLFVSENFSITNRSDRMGFRLYGRRLDLKSPFDMLSSAVAFGTIQMLPNGQTIILMADHQTTGGYPRIGHVIPADLPLVGQLAAGDGIGFHEVSIADAEKATIEFESGFSVLRTACELFYGRI